MCFFLRGDNIGTELKLQYDILGNSTDNIRFDLKDTITKESIYSNDKHVDPTGKYMVT